MHGLNPTDISYLQSLSESDLAEAMATMTEQDRALIFRSLKVLPPPLNQSEKKRKRDRDRINKITATKNEVGQLPECVDPATRQKCLDSLQFFLVHCFPGIFSDPFGEVQVSSIDHEENVIRRGSGKLNKYEPRGYGKSTRSILSAVWGGTERLPRFYDDLLRLNGEVARPVEDGFDGAGRKSYHSRAVP